MITEFMGLGIAIATSAVWKQEDSQNFHLSREIGVDEWEALFLGDLALPEPEREAAEERTDYLSRWEISYKEMMAEKGYPLLGRIWHYNRDVSYSPEEIYPLREECCRLKEKVISELGISALDSLILASDAALKVNSGIFLGAD